MKKRILSIALSIVMLVSLLPTTALAMPASAVSAPEVYVGGVAMYVDDSTVTYYTNGATAAVTEAPAYWNAKYVPTTNTLYIKNLSVVGKASGETAQEVAGICLISSATTTPVHLVIEGTNSVAGANPESENVNSVGIYTNPSSNLPRDLTISGSGTLSATGGVAEGEGGSMGIWCDALTISDGVTINATSDSNNSGSRNCGIFAGGGGGDLTISGGVVNATGGYTGISCGDLTISGGVVNASAVGTSNGTSYGIFAGEVSISGGTVNAVGGTPASTSSSVGFYSGGDLTISGGVVNATGGDASGALTSAGIEADSTLTVEGGVLNATGGSANTISMGIGGDTGDNNVVIRGGVVVATGGSAVGTSLGHYGENGSCSIQMNGGVLVARAGSGQTSVALCAAPTLNGTKVAGQTTDGSTLVTENAGTFNASATGVAIVPEGWTSTDALPTNALSNNTYIVNANADAATFSSDKTIDTGYGPYTLLVVSLYNGSESTSGIKFNGEDDKDSLKISYNGKVIAVGGMSSGSSSCGINGYLMHTDNSASVIAIGGPAQSGSYGVYGNCFAYKTLTAIGGAVKDGLSCGFYAPDNAVYTTGSTTAIGGVSAGTDAADGSAGIFGKSVTVGNVNAVGSTAAGSGHSYGIRSKESVKINNANNTGNAVGGPAAESYGLYAASPAISHGTLNAIGGVATTRSAGLYISGGAISGGTVRGTGGTAANSYGLFYSGTPSNNLSTGDYTGKTAALGVESGAVNNLLADGYGYFAGDTQLEVADNATTVGEPNQTVTVKDIPIVEPAITTSALPGGTVGTVYSQTLEATGTDPIAWSIESGNLPTGLSLNEDSGVISGTPSAEGTFDFTVKATNIGGSGTQELYITIEAAPVYSISADPTTINFGSVQTGYTAPPEAKTVTITNTGNQQITLTQPAEANYTVGALSKSTLAAGETATFTVQPNGSLAAGTYDATITVADNNSANVSISVKFFVVQIYTVSFDANGGEGTMTPQTFTAGQAQALTANAFTRTGYAFAGWNTEEDGSGTEYADKASVTLTADLSLYAQWKPAGLTGVKPTSSANNDGKITGFTDDNKAGVQYRLKGETDWTFVSDVTEITGLAAGTYEVRTASNDQGAGASAITEVTVPAYTGGGSSGGGSTPSTPPTVNITVPVSGEENTVHVDAAVTGESASVAPVDADEVAHIAEGETDMPVTMDFSVLENDITEVKIPTQSIELISETANDPETAVTGLKIDLTHGDIEFDAAALSVIAEMAADADEITVVVDERAAEHLTEAQKEAVQDMPNALILEATVLVNGQPVHNFFGGKATVTFPYQLAAGQSAAFITVWHIADDGAKEAMRTYYNAEREEVNFVAPHLSHYVVTGDEANFAHICPSQPYTDVDQSLWYHEYVDYVIENGLMIGTDTNLFSPYGTLTRAQVVTALWRMEDEPVVNYWMPFEDVAPEQWYTEAVRWAASEKIVEGYGDGTFGHNDPVTREQYAAIFWRYAQYTGMDVSVGEDTNILSYEDAFAVSGYAVPAMQWACGAGLIEGIEQNGKMHLDPQGNATRAQAAAILMRFAQLAQ